MTVVSIGVTIKQATSDQSYQTTLVTNAPGSTSLATLQTDLTTAIANAGTAATSLGLTLVQTDLTALKAATASGDVVLQVNAANAGSMNQVKAGLRAILATLASGVGGITK